MRSEIKLSKELLAESTEKTAKCEETVKLKKKDMLKCKDEMKLWQTIHSLEDDYRMLEAKLLWRAVHDAQFVVEECERDLAPKRAALQSAVGKLRSCEEMQLKVNDTQELEAALEALANDEEKLKHQKNARERSYNESRRLVQTVNNHLKDLTSEKQSLERRLRNSEEKV